MTQKMIFSNIQKADIAKKYLSDKMTIKKISIDYKVSETPIKSVLKELNVKIREPSEASRKYILDNTYFDNIDCYDKAYFLGLLFADGYNDEISGAITLVLVKKDRHILESLVKYLKTNKPVIDAKSKLYSDTSRIQICNKHISQKLANLGCMQNKTFKIKFPDYLDKDLVRHFIRGFFDGDGCISYHYSKKNNIFGSAFNVVITFTSTEDFCLSLQKYFEDNFDIHSSISCRHPSHNNNNNNRTLTVSGNKQVEEITKWMYYDTDLYLRRKHEKFISFCKIRDERGVIVSKLRSDNGRRVMKKVNEMAKDKKEWISIS